MMGLCAGEPVFTAPGKCRQKETSLGLTLIDKLNQWVMCRYLATHNIGRVADLQQTGYGIKKGSRSCPFITPGVLT
ncbi:hypothetical protein [Erwinia phyllosphaerae]|uniref:hypothetical protein n=1 Tax=Erwinia phyllosphaerae TaxID=2853256 RepID=UPI001FEDB1DD|nr:hypothetical protein [Erwinia phyllosphaerae]MBV4367941.1 hypothetical protein [Erwinia phyllosphaerae]